MRFRIIQKQLLFYPEVKGFIGWKRIKNFRPSGISTISSDLDGMAAMNLEDAKELIQQYVDFNTEIVHTA